MHFKNNLCYITLSAKKFLAVPNTYSFTQKSSIIQLNWNFTDAGISGLRVGYGCANLPGKVSIMNEYSLRNN